MIDQPAILIVDDDFSGRTMLSLSLRQAGLWAETASGGKEALRLLKNKRYDWLITDARMSPMDGFRLASEAKRLQPGLRIMMISAVYTRMDADDYPIEKFFAKPVHVEQLLNWISSHPA